MSGAERPSGGMNGDRLPQRVPGNQLHWFGTLPEPVSRPRTERPMRSRRGDAVTFIAESRRLRAEGVAS